MKPEPPQHKSANESRPYYLGCPVWSCADWRGRLFPDRAPQKTWLRYYSQVFPTVEGNTTFYAIPSMEAVHRWTEQVAAGFRFALKYPRVITHEKALRNTATETRAFLEVLSCLRQQDCLGPTFLQFHESFSPARWADLASYLRDLPDDYPFAVELRDHAWFNPPHEDRLNGLLGDLQMDRVVFDSRPLYSAPPSDAWETKSQGRKPRSPVRPYAIGPHPMLRLVGRNDIQSVLPWIREWAPQVGDWIRQGKQPYVFTHTPHDRFAPELAALFHAELAPHVAALTPQWAFPEQAPRQRSLF